MRDIGSAEILAARIRGLQAIYPLEHAALVNWGRWSRDRRGIFPCLTSSTIWDQVKRSELDDYGEEQPPRKLVVPPKAEPPPRLPYDELAGTIMDERLHGAGGLMLEIRLALRTAYVSREIPEDQFPRLTGCSEDAFCERLEAGLRFVGRFL